jgi:hypothetical protein
MRDARDAVGDRWLLVSVSTGAAASLRVFVWRTLRGLGAVYVQQSVCLLPDLPQVSQAVRRLVDRVRAQGGQARLLHVELADAAERETLVAEQRAERDEEYGEVLERVPAFLAELEMETGRGRVTYAEVEESEADLERFEKWLGKIASRDYFHASQGPAAREAVERCRTALAAFEDAAFRAQAGQALPAPRVGPPERPALRPVHDPD